MKKCNSCGRENIDDESEFCPKCGASLVESSKKNKLSFLKKKWVWGLAIFLILLIAISSGGSNSKEENKYQEDDSVQISVVDFATMDSTAAAEWCDTNHINYSISKEYSDDIEKGMLINQSEEANATLHPGDKIVLTYSLGKEPSTEYKNALKKAESYSKTLHMSKVGIYKQLTSEYGEKFPEDAAQYAIDNMEADWNANALEKAKSYQESMSMSKEAIYDQLVSEYGEQFTPEEAQYAIDHLDE